jgi:hypothetical protein
MLTKILEDLHGSELSIGAKQRKLNELAKEAKKQYSSFEAVQQAIPPTDPISRRFLVNLAVSFHNLKYIVDLLKTEEVPFLRYTLKKASSF